MDDISAIIRLRKRAAVFIMVMTVVLLVVCVSAVVNSSRSQGGWFVVLVIFVIMVPLSAGLYAVNAANYPTPKPYYRTFNKVVYIWMAKLGIIVSIISFLLNIKRALNPFEGGMEGGRQISSKAEDLIEAGSAAGGGIVSYHVLKSGRAVEQYFAEREARERVATAAPAPDVPAVSLQPVSPEKPNTYTTDSSRR
jgi:hypothetical protein